AGEDPTFDFLARLYPIFAIWSDGANDLGRSAEATAWLFERFGLNWAASTWNEPASLVQNAAAHHLEPTRFGRIVQRALVAPTEPYFPPYPVFDRSSV